jgi:hypothetical protein
MALELIRAPGAGTATDVRRLLAHRIAELPPDSRALLRVVAALAEPTVDAVGEDGLEPALAADVLARHGHRLRFTHPLIAAVVEERTPPAEWRANHAHVCAPSHHAGLRRRRPRGGARLGRRHAGRQRPGPLRGVPATDRPRGPGPGRERTTLALVVSGSALLIAAGAAAMSGHDHRRIGKVA